MSAKQNIYVWTGGAWIEAKSDAAGRLEIVTVTGSLPSVAVATPGKVAVGVASTSILAANTARIFAQFVNDSDTVIYLWLGAVAVINEGIRLNANGGSFEINLTNLYTGAVHAIAGGAAKNLTVTEG